MPIFLVFFQLSDMYKFITPRQKAIFEEKFEELDTNSNGKVTLKELTTQMKKVNAPKPEIKKFMQVSLTGEGESEVKGVFSDYRIVETSFLWHKFKDINKISLFPEVLCL